jgi:hypothetical protein
MNGLLKMLTVRAVRSPIVRAPNSASVTRFSVQAGLISRADTAPHLNPNSLVRGRTFS